MNDSVIVLTPLLVLLILALFGFTGCKPFSGTLPATPPPPKTYEEYEKIVKNTGGFAALWPLNEESGNQAKVEGSLTGANGTYLPAGSAGPILGQSGALFPKIATDFAPKLDGTGAYIEVPFNAQLNTAAPFSVELWVKPNPAAGGNEQVLISSYRFDATTKRGYEIALVKKTGAHHEVRGRVFSTGGAANAGQVTVQPNQGQPDDWRHIVLTYGVDGVTLWVRVAGHMGAFKDGPNAAVYQNVQAFNAVPLRFGAGHQQGPNPRHFFAGLIDNVAFYNAVLSDSDIENHFKQSL